MEKFQLIERSIITTYRKKIWAKFIKALKTYNLLVENDRVLICMSGGKDSFLLAKLFEELRKHSDFPFEYECLIMDPGYKKEIRKQIEDNLKLLNVKATIVDSDIFEITDMMGGKPCFLCARMRRGFLYKQAEKLNCNKIALGHHFDDAIETLLLSMFYNGKIQTMPPKLISDNYKGLELIRPMYLIHEQDIINWTKYNELNFINCACKFSDTKSNYDSKRLEVKNIIKDLKKINPIIPNNLFESMHNLNLDTILGFYKDRSYHDFNELYESRSKECLNEQES